MSAGLAVSFSLSTTRANTAAVDQVRIRVTGSGVAVDTTLAIGPAPETRLQLRIVNQRNDSLYRVTVDFRRDSVLLFRGDTTTRLTSGETTALVLQLDPTPTAARSLTTGSAHSCALDEIGAAFCWGSNQFGQTGRGAIGGVDSVPVRVVGNRTFAQISAGGPTTCAITLQGAAFCWGYMFGTATQTGTPMPLPGAVAFASIAVSGGNFSSSQGNVVNGVFACGVDLGGQAFCVGSNSSLQLGLAAPGNVSVPTAVATATRFRSIEVGQLHTCGVATDGRAFCWGSNVSRESGTSVPETIVRSPTLVSGGLVFTAIAPGVGATCGIATQGTFCWGKDTLGILGNGATASRGPTATPALVVGNRAFTALRAGSGSSTTPLFCGVTSAGQAFCWGANLNGQLGTSTGPVTCVGGAISFTCTGTPTPVDGGLTFAAVVPAGSHTCGITTARRVFCWGLNSSGQLGNRSTVSSNTPVPVVTTP